MPDSAYAVGVIIVAIVPGFLFLQGYHRGREQPTAPDLFVLAKAVFTSLVLVSAFWLVPRAGPAVASWIREGEVEKHRIAVVGLLVGMFAFAFVVGLGLGWAVESLGKREGHSGRFLRWAGFRRTPSLWAALSETRLTAPQLVEVRLKSGDRIIGAFDQRSAAALDLSEMFLSETFAPTPTGGLIPQNRVLYLRGDDILSISMGPLET